MEKRYLDFFAMGSPHETGWPKVQNPRFKKPRSLSCIRFQVKGSCTEGCRLAYITKSKMTNKQETDVTAKFKAVYGKDGVNYRKHPQVENITSQPSVQQSKRY